jgi:hypothetical protein
MASSAVRQRKFAQEVENQTFGLSEHPPENRAEVVTRFSYPSVGGGMILTYTLCRRGPSHWKIEDIRAENVPTEPGGIVAQEAIDPVDSRNAGSRRPGATLRIVRRCCDQSRCEHQGEPQTDGRHWSSMGRRRAQSAWLPSGYVYADGEAFVDLVSSSLGPDAHRKDERRIVLAAGALSAIQFTIRYPHRCSALVAMSPPLTRPARAPTSS